jgi:hypothetical protein
MMIMTDFLCLAVFIIAAVSLWVAIQVGNGLVAVVIVAVAIWVILRMGNGLD